jgi:hypothetical protein
VRPSSEDGRNRIRTPSPGFRVYLSAPVIAHVEDGHRHDIREIDVFLGGDGPVKWDVETAVSAVSSPIYCGENPVESTFRSPKRSSRRFIRSLIRPLRTHRP